MKRKVNRVGQNTLTVSLPSKWAEKFKIKKGQELEITEKDRTLIISYSDEKNLGQKDLDLRNVVEYAKRMVILPYICGYDVIKVHYKDREMLKAIRKTMDFLMGFEIIEEKGGYLIIKNVAKGIESEFLPMISRFFQITSVMGNELYEIISHNDLDMLENIFDYELDTDKINIFCRRLLNVQGSPEKRNTTTIYYVNCLVESVSDVYGDIANYFSQHRFTASKDFLLFFQSILHQYSMFLEMYNHYNPNQISEMKKLERKIQENYLNNKFNKHEMYLSSFLMRAHYAIHHATEDIE